MTSKLKPDGAFLHIPRTGGTWVYRRLAEAGIASIPLGHEHTSGHNEAWAFCVVRNPVEWWLSLWRFHQDNTFPGYQDAQHPLHDLGAMRDANLREWVRRASTEFAGFCGDLYKQFASRSDYVLRSDEIRSQLKTLATIKHWRGIDFSAPPANVSRAVTDTQDIDLEPLRNAEAEAVQIWLNSGI